VSAWSRDAKVNRRSLGSALCFVALGAEEGEGEVDAFGLADPVLGVGTCSTVQEVGLRFRGGAASWC
jgi:hypothetical protein